MLELLHSPKHELSFSEIKYIIRQARVRRPGLSRSRLEAFRGSRRLVFPAMPAEEAKTWSPYEGCAAGCPLANLLPGRVVDPAAETWWAVRWCAAWPLHRRVPGLGWSVGELLFVPVLAGGALGVGLANWGDVEGSGYPATFLGALTYATGCRNSLLALLTGVPFERALFYHKVIAVLAILAAGYHGYVALSHPEDNEPAIGTQAWSLSVLAGEDNFSGVMLVAGWLAATLVALVWIRRYLFEVFNRLHIVAAIVALYFAAQHGATTTLIGGGLWALDKLLSALSSLGRANGAQGYAARARVLPSDVVEISFPRGNFKYKGGQWCNMWVPALGLQWHPFSLSSSPHDEQVTIHIRALGAWTRALVQKVASESYIPFPVYVDGPFGAVGLDIDGRCYKSFLLLGGGIGVTPMRSIWRELLEQRARGRQLGRMRLLWSVRDSEMLEAIRVESEGDAKVEIYLTREKEIDAKRAVLLGEVMEQVVLGKRPDLEKAFEETRSSVFRAFAEPKMNRSEEK